MSKNNNIDKVVHNNKKNKTLNSKKTIVAMFIGGVFLIYCIYILIKLLVNPTDTFIVENGKIYKEEASTGYIIRDELVVQNEGSSGNVIHLKAEGKKVANGEAIYRYSMENEEALNQQIKDLDNKIQEALEQETTLFSTDIKLLENQIEIKLENVYENTDIQKIKQYKKEIANSISKKAKVAGELAPSSSYVKQLIKQRSECENQLNSGSNYVYANKSGIISYRVDGLENKLSIGDFSYLNKQFLESLNLRTSQIIALSENNAKIIDNFKCYITCISSSEEALNAEVGNKIKVRLPTAEEIPAKIVYKNNENDKETLLVFEIEQCVENLINHRKISFDIIWWSDSGIKVPNSAIYYEGDFAYVLRNRAGYEEKIIVKVLRQNDDYSIVDNYGATELEEAGYDLNALGSKKSISIYDEIIIKTKK